MAGPYTGGSKALGFFGSILGSAYERATTAEVWAGIQSAATSVAASIVGIPVSMAQYGTRVAEIAAQLTSGITIQDVNQLRSIAGQMVSARNTLASASSEWAIDSSMIGNFPVMGTGPGTGLPQSYNIRITYTSADSEGNLSSSAFTIHTDQLPETVGDLNDMVQAETGALVSTGAYNPAGSSLVSVDTVSIETA